MRSINVFYAAAPKMPRSAWSKQYKSSPEDALEEAQSIHLQSCEQQFNQALRMVIIVLSQKTPEEICTITDIT